MSLTPKARMQAVLDAEATAIAALTLTDQHEQAVAFIAACAGKVVTTGMGKAGLIARKMAATLCATGTPALYLHPGDAAHGDLGVLSYWDVLIAYSTSGHTTEILDVLQRAKGLEVRTIIGITSHPDSPFRQYCDLVLEMGQIQEPCPIGLTPSASTTVMLALSDALALAAMELRGFSREDFGLRHHGGYLGRQCVVDPELRPVPSVPRSQQSRRDR